MRFLARAFGVLSLVAATAVVVTGGVASAAEPKVLNVMSWNMCGVIRWGCTSTADAKIGVVKYHVANTFVQAALLQEVCEDDLTTLMGELGSGWSKAFTPYLWSQDGKTSPITCDTDRAGTAIIAKVGLSDVKVHATTQPWTGMHRPLLCATATYWATRLCSVHLTPHPGGNPDHPEWDYRDDQIGEIKGLVAGFPNFVIGGDFNVKPPQWPGTQDAWVWGNGLYYDGTSGYVECDQQGSVRTGGPTHDSNTKIDYIFSSETRRWCARADSAHSDHHVLVESVEVV